MTHKDFKLIAAALAETRPGQGFLRQTNVLEKERYLQWAQVCSNLAAALSTTNASFSHEWFFNTCSK